MKYITDVDDTGKELRQQLPLRTITITQLYFEIMEGQYFTYIFPPTGDIIGFCKTTDGSIYSQVDDSFAHANGFKDLKDMQTQIYKDGGPTHPEWMLWHSELMNGMR